MRQIFKNMQLFLFIVAISLLLTISKAKEQVPCYNIQPGIVRMSRGVDITKLDLVPFDLSADNGFLRTLFSFTCSKQKKWVSPYTSLVYDIPDQVESINSVPGGVLDVVTTEFSNYEDTKKNLATSFGLGSAYLKGYFSVSASTKLFTNTIINTTRKTVEFKSHFSAIQVDFARHWELTLAENIQSYVNTSLPETYIESPSKYNDFIQNYGTHYFSRGRFGGSVRITMDYETSQTARLSEVQVKLDTKTNFLNIVKSNAGGAANVKGINLAVRHEQHGRIQYFGGSTNMLNSGRESGWQDWWSSVPSNPWLYGGRLESITQLLPEGPKKAALTTAITVFLDKAYLEELRRILSEFQGKRYVDGGGALSRFQARGTQLAQEPQPDHDLILRLGREIENYFISPDWFTKYAQLCYNWEADGNAGQCGGDGVGPTLCAHVNQMTQYYRDDTDWRAGGCKMRWGIVSPASPVSQTWFRQVKLCFKWHADWDAGQCGGKKQKKDEVCAAVGDYTPFYRDDTDLRYGGCQMAWRLLVPQSAPGWARNLNLCFTVETDPAGNVNQCGDRLKTRCASANNWTDYYKDDTDLRWGGCRMSWGIRTFNS